MRSLRVLEELKLNTVALRGLKDDELGALDDRACAHRRVAMPGFGG
jgi:hypothetical protein